MSSRISSFFQVHIRLSKKRYNPPTKNLIFPSLSKEIREKNRGDLEEKKILREGPKDQRIKFQKIKNRRVIGQ